MNVRVNVSINNISAERFWDSKRPFPPVKIATNLNIIRIDKTDNMLQVPFVFTINYNPGVAQMSLKGRAHVAGDTKELENIYSSYGKKKAPPQTIVQTILNVVVLESVVISRSLGIPPPIPLPKVPLKRDEKKETELTYRA